MVHPMRTIQFAASSGQHCPSMLALVGAHDEDEEIYLAPACRELAWQCWIQAPGRLVIVAGHERFPLT
jgi:hypothetical protein